MMTSVGHDELSLLSWLAIQDAQYGECKGKTLDAMMERGFVEWVQGGRKGDDYSWVGLSDLGWNALGRGRALCSHPYKSKNARGDLVCGVCGKWI